MKKVLLILLTILLISCNKREKELEIEKLKSEKPQPKIIKEIKTQKPIIGLEKIAPIYLNYIRKKYPDFIIVPDETYYQNSEVTYYNENDIDGDGNMEALIAIGGSCDCKAGTYLDQILILRNKNNKVEEITSDLNSDIHIPDFVDGGIVSINLVKLKGLKNYYIECLVKPEIYWHGLLIVKIQNNKPKVIFESFPNGAYGTSTLLDSHNDDEYDTIKEELGSISSLFEPTFTFKLKNENFVLTKTEITLENYPESIEDVIYEYISLKKESFIHCLEADERIKELCVTKSHAYNPTLGLYGAKLTDIKEFNNTATAILSETTSKKSIYTKKFKLKKTGSKWQIVDIK